MKKRILVAPLNWGLGHATRCIPLINALIEHNFEPVIASDGIALTLLQKEFPDLKTASLPSYQIRYPKKGQLLKLKLLKDTPKIIKVVKAEKKKTASIIKTHHINGIISDNRFGVYSKHIKCVFITHQLQVLSGNTTWLSTRLHQKIISRFDECWIPDAAGEKNLSGKLGHRTTPKITTQYIGSLSRFTKTKVLPKYDIMVLLSGPEPQRTLLEQKLLSEFKLYKGRVIFIKGLVEERQTKIENGRMTIYNFMTSKDLETALNESKLIVARSGYTTIMDLAKLNKKAFFIPTPGQFEQEYLAKRLTKLGYAPSCKQNNFSIAQLTKVDNFNGLEDFDTQVDFKNLFGLF